MNKHVEAVKASRNHPIQDTGASKFTMRGLPLLLEGASFDALANSENLWLSAKVYSSGGENALHIHTLEDHAFVVLKGKATFYFADGSQQEAIEFEGVMIPKGIAYRFEADEAENLVLLRVGAAQRQTSGVGPLVKSAAPLELKDTTVDFDGSIKDGRDPKTGTPSKPIVHKPDSYFPEDR
jgi:quercetin dioxygenase-like cupin family protein